MIQENEISSELTLFDPSDKNYKELLVEAKHKILSTRIKISKAACQEQIRLYWWFGEKIVEAQIKHGWGKSIIERFSMDLKKDFSDSSSGFSPRNLWEMRSFYLAYKDCPNLQQVVADLPWGQNLLILHKVKDIKAREYYIEATRQMGWTRDVLTIQINSQAYERHVLSPKAHNFARALPKHLAEQADKAMKSVYMLDTLGITTPVLEKVIESKMINKIKEVMLELGYGFAFIGRQYRIATDGHEYFIDLLFYNRRLGGLVAMDIKSGKFKPEYAGKMNFYLNLLDDFVREEKESPSIGIILCAEQDNFEVEYALRGIDKPVGVAMFQLTKNLPKELYNKLPSPKEIENEIRREMERENDV